MNSLFNPQQNSAIIERINKLSSSSQPAWGKMNTSQMLAHCQVPLKLAAGEMTLKRGLIGILFGGLAKKAAVSENPFKKNLPTDKAFIIPSPGTFEEEKKKLVTLVKQFSERGAAGLSPAPHPFFGKMNTNEWDALQWKHLDHHLRQFGV